LIHAPGNPEYSRSAETQVLILSDGKPGHLNQSLAFARLLNCSFQVRQVVLRNRFCKSLSYLLDRFGIHSHRLFLTDAGLPNARLVVSTGSGTYYANKAIAGALNARSIALMWPAGYRADFDLIVAQRHDRPPRRDNLLELPVNLSCPQQTGVVPAVSGGGACVALIIGGPSKHFEVDLARLEQQLRKIFHLFPDGDFLVTTSRRTPAAVEQLLETFPFRYRLLYSRCQDNPIGDFLGMADYLFITEDSTSMVSEAVSWGRAAVEILRLGQSSSGNKISRMMEELARRGCLHWFDGTIGSHNQKIELQKILKAAIPHSWLSPDRMEG